MLVSDNIQIEYSVVVPVFNSREIVYDLYLRLIKVLEKLQANFEIILVDDCGSDGAWSVVKKPSQEDDRVVAIELMHNSGQGTATLCGIAHARGAVIITIDDDLQHPPEEIPVLLQKLLENEDLDVVIGIPKSRAHSFFRNLASNFVNRMNSIFLMKDVNLKFSGFRVMRRDIAKALLTIRSPYPAIGPMLISTTRRIANVVVEHCARSKGKSSYSLRSLIKTFLSNFIGYSMLPLRALALLGFFGIAGCSIYAVGLLAKYVLWGTTVQGWTSTMLVLISLSGFNFFAFAVLGEYLIRIFRLQTHSEQYFIRSIIRK